MTCKYSTNMNLWTRFLRGSLFIAVTLIVIAGCRSLGKDSKQMEAGCKQPLQQGLQGKVVFKSGNLMPSPDAPAEDGGSAVEREVYIYELTQRSQTASEENQFFSNIQTQLVKKVRSDATGCFQAYLEPGRYSVFVMEKGRLYANMFDGQGNIFPVEVNKAEVTDIVFEITYEATF
jgi:hypothetical protein